METVMNDRNKAQKVDPFSGTEPSFDVSAIQYSKDFDREFGILREQLDIKLDTGSISALRMSDGNLSGFFDEKGKKSTLTEEALTKIWTRYEQIHNNLQQEFAATVYSAIHNAEKAFLDSLTFRDSASTGPCQIASFSVDIGSYEDIAITLTREKDDSAIDWVASYETTTAGSLRVGAQSSALASHFDRLQSSER